MKNSILIDGSNVLFWRANQADLQVVRSVVYALIARRFVPIVCFDHSIVAYMKTHTSDGMLTSALDLAEAQIVIAPKGTPADPLLLEIADRTGVQIVSLDRFRAWKPKFPRLRGDWLVTGQIGRGGRVDFSKKLRRPPL